MISVQKAYQRMDQEGIRIDRSLLLSICKQREDTLRDELQKWGYNSVRDLKKDLVERLKKDSSHSVTQSGVPSTEKGHLKNSDCELAQPFSFTNSLQREISILSKYYANSVNGRLYPAHKISDEGGRVYVGKFNYTNLSKDCRKIVLAERYQNFWEFDFDRAELWVLAKLSQDDVLTEALTSGDVHSELAKEMFRMSKPTDEQRRAAKVVNFGIIYGGSPYFLSKELNCSVGQAISYHNTFTELYSDAWAYICKIHAMADAGVSSISTNFGTMKSFKNRAKPGRSMVSHRIQGTLGEITQMVLPAVSNHARELGGFLRMSLFDSYIVSLPGSTGDVRSFIDTIQKACQPFGFPLRVSMKFWGPRWNK